jgi:nucleoside-diphosphate-sugar epimerase
MSTRPIAVLGASGFVGGAFVDRMLRTPGARVVPFIHSSGNAADLARRGLELKMVDLLSPASVAEALRGCSSVVNCSRGGKEVLSTGFQNLLDASIAAGVERFVHVSSVAAYGDTPPGEIREDRTPAPAPNSYGASKLQQDEAVLAAVKRGLPAVVVCPPNISGPNSPFLLDIVNNLRSGQFGLVDDGTPACELVDVDNLAYAMQLALNPAIPADGQRIFVTDQAPATWGDLIDHLTPLAEQPPRYRIGREEADALAAPPPAARASLGKLVKHLMSSDVREALRKDPLIANAEMWGKWAVRAAAPPGLQRRLRQAADGNTRPRPRLRRPSMSVPLLRQQLRDVRYSTERARTVLGYTPVVPFEDSMRRFGRWYGEMFAWGTEWWPLLKQLY